MARPINFAVALPNEPHSAHHAAQPDPDSCAETRAAVYLFLEQARQQGLFDLLRGIMGAKNTIFSEAANLTDTKTSTNAIRNGLVLAKVLGAINPDTLTRASNDVQASSKRLQFEQPPSLWQIFKRMRRPESRRGLAIAVAALSAIGSAAETEAKK